MDANEREFLDEIVKRVIGSAYEVANQLGSGFLEKVYERALEHELSESGMRVISQHDMPVKYKGKLVGSYFVDLLVENQVIVELKCVDKIGKEHFAQCINYLKASDLKVCLLINFGHSKVEWKRIVNGI